MKHSNLEFPTTTISPYFDVDFNLSLTDVKMNHVRTNCSVSIRNMVQGSDPASVGKMSKHIYLRFNLAAKLQVFMFFYHQKASQHSHIFLTTKYEIYLASPFSWI